MAQSFDPDQFTSPFQLTKSMHRDVYPAVDPTNPALSVKGKVVLIAGAGGGLGYATAKAWSTAHAAGIALMGRSAKSLESTAAELEAPHLVVTGDIAAESDVQAAIEKTIAEFGHLNVVVDCAGTTIPGTIGEIDVADWWSSWETNLKGSYNLAHHFIRATGSKGTLINVVSLGASFLFPGMSAYAGAKLAQIKLGESIDVEHPNLRVFSVHPGLVEAQDGRGAVVDALTPFAKDTPQLFAGVSLYLSTSDRAEFLRGGYLSVNWDVEELEAHKAEIKEKGLVKLGFLKGGLGVGGYKWEVAA